MTAVTSREALEDPVGIIVDLVAGREPWLDRAVIAKVTQGVAGGRAKRRRLAQALLDNAGVLADGRSPAPRAVADLLLSLRNAGAVNISPPVCAECGKQLRSYQRRGEDWYCSSCGPVWEQCSACGHVRCVNSRDRAGQPRCSQCPPDDGDPVTVITEIVTRTDPSLTAETVTAAVMSAVPRAGQRRPLAWALQDQPGLLTGAGAEAPVPAVLRLIDRLCDAGAQTVVHPACPACGRVMHLHRPIGGKWLCRTCTARSRAQPCSRCGAVREAATRDEHGRPLCPSCLSTDPVNQEECIKCGRRRPVSVRTPGGPLCPACRPVPVATCSICGREAPCETSAATGKPWCRACKQRWARCARCGTMAPVRGGTADAPLCSTCTVPGAEFWRACPGCGQEGRIALGQCKTCRLRGELREMLTGPDGAISPALQGLYGNLADHERPSTVLAWLGKGAVTTVLREIAAGQRALSHEALDELPDGKPLRHLRTILVATGTLPPRDEQMARLEAWIAQAVAERPDAGERRLLHQYATWHVVRRLRSRLAGQDATYGQFASAQRNVRAAIALLTWLTARGLDLENARQGDLDTWMDDTEAVHRTNAGNFVRWARRNKLTTLGFAAVKWGGPSGVIDTETRWEQARRLLHDDSIKPGDRAAGLFVLLYAQQLPAISRLTLGHVEAAGSRVLIRLGREPVVLPEPLDTLVLKVAAIRRGHAALGDDGTSSWLFPGGQPGQPISAFQLGERLRQLGIRPGQSRSAALFQLATDLPAAILANMLGIHISVAVQWQRASAGDWTAYAAEVSRRAREPHT